MTATLTNHFAPDYASSPGDMLQEWLDEHSLTQAEFAVRTGRTRKSINELIKGEAPVNAETALILDRVTGVPAALWTGMEAAYRTCLAREKEQENLPSYCLWSKHFSYLKMSRLGWVPHTSNPKERACNLLSFFGIRSPDQWHELYECVEGLARTSPKYKNNSSDLSAWLRQGELQAAQLHCLPFDQGQFIETLKILRRATVLDITEQANILFSLCSRSGVAFVLVPELPNTHVSGFTRWLSPQKALIQQSLRHKRNDHLWFTFFHEAAHLLLHGKKERFLEVDGVNDVKEEEANEWARDFLIPRNEWTQFISRFDGRFSNEVVKAFASELEIAPAIVAGRLQYEKLVPHSWYKDLFVRMDLAGAVKK